MPDIAARIAENVARIRGRIADAAGRAGRTADEITLVAVTKYVTAAEIRALAAAGCFDLGESRSQQLWQRAAELADLPLRWHMIGHLQRNKLRRTLPLVSMIQSVDSHRLLAAIDAELPHISYYAGQIGDIAFGGADIPVCQGDINHNGRQECLPHRGEKCELAAAVRPLPLLLEVNTSGEAAKGGLQPGEVEPLLAELPKLRSVEVRGLMCMASLEGGLDAARRDFAALRNLRDRLRSTVPPGVGLDELSMGMSGDFEVAIEEGATLVRIGSALFEGVC